MKPALDKKFSAFLIFKRNELATEVSRIEEHLTRNKFMFAKLHNLTFDFLRQI